MPYFDSDGVRINYEIEGEGPEVIMVHGFAADLHSNWRLTRVTDTLRGENRMIMMDCRGHGKSQAPHDPALYGPKMRDDISNLMDHLGIKQANFIGYSMGSRLCLDLLLHQPGRFRAVILGGFGLPPPGAPSPASPGRNDAIINALLADSLDEVTDPTGHWWRQFAESTGCDPKALAALRIGSQPADLNARLDEIRAIRVPLLTIVGNDDTLVADRSRLAMLVPNGCHFQVQGKDHVSVVAGTRFRLMVRAFLNFVNGN